ncbi:MAG: lipid-A-disaccharide synthase N-terminal domain-containing protein [Candidatus Sumerlaeota bacterium]
MHSPRIFAPLFLCFFLTAASAFSQNRFSPAPLDKERREQVASFLSHLEGQWAGNLSLHKSDGSVETLHMQAAWMPDVSGNGAWDVTIRIHDDATPQTPAAAQWLFRVEEAAYRWQPRPDGPGLSPWVARDGSGTLDTTNLSWFGPDSHMTMTLMGETKMDMLWSGRWPLPDDIGDDVVGQTAQLRKQGFRFKIGPFELVVMEFVGIFATLFFASRFVIQWIASERAKRSVMPEIFWWVSLIGSGLMLIYAIYFGRFAVLLGQLTGWTVYVRNIWLIEREKRQRRHEAQAQE